MDRDTLIKRLMATFLVELQDQVSALNRDLLALEKEPKGPGWAGHLKELFRTTHSLKGAARSVNVTLIGDACHGLEEVLKELQDGRLASSPELFTLLYATVDNIEEAGQRLREQHDLAGAPLEALLPRLRAVASGASVTPAAQASPSPAAEGEAPTSKTDFQSVRLGRDGFPIRPTQEAPVEPTAGPSTVRVAAKKLDAFLARNGELLVARRRVEGRLEDLSALHDLVGRWKREWLAVEKPLAPLLRDGDRAGRAALPRRVAQALGGVGNNLRRLEKELERLGTAMTRDGRILHEAAAAVDDEVRQVRLLPFAEACQGLERVVRDLAAAEGKEVELVVEGGDVELDRSVLEGLKDPLRHLVRNAVDHGVEAPAKRQAAGKPGQARVTVAAVLRGAVVEVTVADDGRGLDLEALRQQLRRRNLPEPADEQELARVIFQPGLSTARLITDVSGRGVGLDVVKSRVEGLHGSVDVSFAPGRGTRFTLAVPLTLTTLRVLLVKAAGQTFGLVGTTVQKLVRIDPAKVRSVEGREMLALGEVPVPLASLAETLGLPNPGGVARPEGKAPAVIVAVGDRRLAFVVDEFLAQQEVVVTGLGARIRRLRHVSAATILPSGRIAPVLNSAELLRSALQRTPAVRVAAGPQGPALAKKRILVADDSVTTRTLEKSILEAAGYEVAVAADGSAAWQLLQEHGADLLVSDVDMPLMDGFALTEAVRGSRRFQDLPVVLVTARESEADRARGIAVRADAYLGKSAFDQRNLLETIAQLL
jgi:two-component system chemotaxis sensor kinase CheA